MCNQTCSKDLSPSVHLHVTFSHTTEKILHLHYVIELSVDIIFSLYVKLNSSWWILFNFEHNDPLHWIKVVIDLGVLSPYLFLIKRLGVLSPYLFLNKRQNDRCQNGLFCYLYRESLFSIWFWWLFLLNSRG
jgi:hypothetical protein